MVAGGSASALADEHARRAREASHAAGRAKAGAVGEREVAAALAALTVCEWTLLADRRLSPSSAANIDMILVGPGGVFVIDAKNWQHSPLVADGRLTRGGEDCDGEVASLLRITRLVEDALEGIGVSPVAVSPLMVFARRSLDLRLGRLRLLGAKNVLAAVAGHRHRLTAIQVQAVAVHLAGAFPEYQTAQPTLNDVSPGTDDEQLPTMAEIREMLQAHERAVQAGPIEDWMTFLHPEQVDIVRRRWRGPARISGPAGTGKTVVALHRAAMLAASGPVLYTTLVRNLPMVGAGLLARVNGDVVDRVEFCNLHRWALNFLESRGMKLRLDQGGCFFQAWRHAGRGTVLEKLEPNPIYWQEELDKVIKGRGITDVATYLAIDRDGRRMPLHDTHRAAVWELYERYERIRSERGRHDFADILTAALAEARRVPLEHPYASVIVDEVQDLSLVGVKLAHALVGDGPDGLLLVGDGQQKVYPGGFRLVDAGIDVRGRARVLRINYRNGSAILERALRFLGGESFEDIDGTQARPVDPIAGERRGEVVDVFASTAGEVDRALVNAIRSLPDTPEDRGSAAVLCAWRRDVDRYIALLTKAGVAVQDLKTYHGVPTARAKVGTFLRAKGLEFKQAYLPHYDESVRVTDHSGPSDADRFWLARNQVFVGMTRARDLLWLGTVSRP